MSGTATAATQYVCLTCGYNMIGGCPDTCPFCGAGRDRIITQEECAKRFRVHATMLIDMAKNMDLTSIAEGVETDEQLDCLKKRQCKEVQGYIYSRPLASADFTKYLKKRLSN